MLSEDEAEAERIQGSLESQSILVRSYADVTVEDTSLVLVDLPVGGENEAALVQLLASGDRPLILLLDADSDLPDFAERSLLPRGYQAPVRPIKYAPVLEVRHAELDHKKHFDVGGYWEQRYLRGGNSGAGSYGRLARFKARFLNNFVREQQISTVVELGCGDGAQLALADYPQYTGLDISETAIMRCRDLFEADDWKHFYVYRPGETVTMAHQAELALSLDVIYHLSNDDIYREYLRDLFTLSSRYVIIYASSESVSPSGVDESASYMRFRDFISDIETWFPDWTLIDAVPNRYPYSRLTSSDTSFSDFYVFDCQTSVEASIDRESMFARYQRDKLLNLFSVQDDNAYAIDKRLRGVSGQLDTTARELSGQYEDLKNLQKDHASLARASLERLTHSHDEVGHLRALLSQLDRHLLGIRVASEDTSDRAQRIPPNPSLLAEKFREVESAIAQVGKIVEWYRARKEMVEASTSYRFGRAIIDALKKPGINTVKAPLRLLRAFGGSRQKEREDTTSLPDIERALSSLDQLRQGLQLDAEGFGSAEGKERWHKNVALTEEPAWFSLTVPNGAAVNIIASLDNGEDVPEQKSVVAIVECVDEFGQPVSEGPPGFAYSAQLQCHYRYVPTSPRPIVIAGFLPPVHTRHVLIGFRTFHAVRGRTYRLTLLSIDAGAGAVATRLDGAPSSQHGDQEATLESFTPPSQAAMEASILGWPPPRDTNNPLALAVMDEFTEGCFADDLRLLQPRPDNWYALAETYPPDFVFVESAWKGNGGSWQYRVGSYSVKPGTELAHMTAWARQRRIPSIFWNKEDPVHHRKFVEAAGLTDYIFTTDANMVDSYRRATGNQNVYALPFAAQPRLHKPAALEGRIPKACFAGSWYGDRHEERGEAMKWLLRAALTHGLDIFDRNYGTGKFPFPEQYQASIRGSLPYLQLCEEYRRYRVFLNVNSVTDSPTMFSRRVFELLASGTPVVSTYACGIEEMFGNDIVWFVRDAEEADEALRTLLEDDTEWRRRSLAGIRAVFAEHTYAHRLNQIFDMIGVDEQVETTPSILLLARARSAYEIEPLANIAAYQSYRNFQVLVSSGDQDHAHAHLPSNVTIVPETSFEHDELKQRIRGHSAIGWISPDCRYGTGYVRDLANAMLYRREAKGWAKAVDGDRFAYGHAAHLAGAIWEPDAFVELWSNQTELGSVTHDELFLIDAEEFEASI